MNRLMSRYKGLILSCMSMMMIAVCVCSLSFESKASTSAVHGQEFTMNYPEPSTGEYQGYVHLLMYNPDTVGSGYYVTTYFWTCFAVSDGKNSPCVMQVTINENSVEFAPFGASNKADSAFYVISGITNNGTFSTKKYSSTQRYSPSFQNKIVGYKMSGNVMIQTSISNSAVPFTVYYAPDKSTQLLMDVYDMLSTMNTQQHLDSYSLWMKLIDILSECETIEEQIEKTNGFLSDNQAELEKANYNLGEILKRLNNILDEQKTQTSWLKKIWESIQKLISPEDKDSEKTDEMQSSANDKTNQLNDLNEQNKTDKTDIDDASNSVDENIDLESVDNYGSILSVITGNTYVVQMLLIVFSFVLIAYVLFGKKK